MKRRTISLLALILAAVMTLGLAMNAAAMDDNPVEGIVDVGPEDTMKYNQGTVSNNEGTVENNYGTVEDNYRTVSNNEGTVEYNKGTVENNKGTVENNDGIVENNERTVENNDGTVKNNYGIVVNNERTVENNDGTVENNERTVEYNYRTVGNNEGTVKNNYRTVENNDGTVENNYGTVEDNYRTVENNFSGATVTNNYGTVKKNLGTVENNFGGTIEEGSQPQNQYYELPNPQDNFSYEDATWSYNSWWIKSDATVTIKAADGFYFESASISGGLGTITVADDHKSCTLSNVTGSLANGGLTLTVQAGEYVPEPTPTPDPRPTTPPADSTTAAEAASAPTVQQMESAERPDPQDVEANKRYNFWMGVKSDLRAAGDGRTVRVYVPADYTNMPASVMEQIRLLEKDITVDLRWGGERLIITPATAQRKTALKAFWTFEQLCELYGE